MSSVPGCDITFDHDCPPAAAPWSWAGMLKEYGSKRRIFEAYWNGSLSEETERHIEAAVDEHTVVGYKPI